MSPLPEMAGAASYVGTAIARDGGKERVVRIYRHKGCGRTSRAGDVTAGETAEVN